MRHADLTPLDLNRYAVNLTAFARMAFVVIVFLVLAMFLMPVHAQTTPALTFGASVTSANGSLATKLTWSTTPAATSCTAAGHSAWTGTKPASGSLDLPAITLSGTYTLILNCTWAADTQAILTWRAPTTNTDGSTLTNLKSFNVLHGLSATVLPDIRVVDAAAPTVYTWTGLAAGNHYFGVKAVNSEGAVSDISNVEMKTITASVTKTDSVTLTVNPKPGNPSNLAVQ